MVIQAVVFGATESRLEPFVKCSLSLFQVRLRVRRVAVHTIPVGPNAEIIANNTVIYSQPHSDEAPMS
jgi:hypothetical protein